METPTVVVVVVIEVVGIVLGTWYFYHFKKVIHEQATIDLGIYIFYIVLFKNLR